MLRQNLNWNGKWNSFLFKAIPFYFPPFPSSSIFDSNSSLDDIQDRV